MAKQTILEESTRVYDEAFSAWLGNCLVDYDSLGGSPKTDFPILRVYAAPDRSFAPVADMLVAREFVSASDAAAMRERAETDRDMRIFPLPLLTLTRGDPVIEPRGSQAKVIERAAFDPLKGVWQRHRMPTFYRTPTPRRSGACTATPRRTSGSGSWRRWASPARERMNYSSRYNMLPPGTRNCTASAWSR